MAKSIKGTLKKRRGRPPTTGRGTQVGMRWQEPELAVIDAWRGEEMTRPQAIRCLVEIGLSNASRRQQRPPKENAARAADLAAKVIDRQIAPETPAEERAVRKRKLLQGPSIVREARKDRPK